MKITDIPAEILANVKRGVVIPAHPLALNADRSLDERRQRALTRYYIDAGVGGVAVGVHTTQFAIRDPKIALLEPVLTLASETIDSWSKGRSIVKIAGVCGRTDQAAREAQLAREKGYHAGLLSLAAWPEDSVPDLVSHCREIADIIPVVGFYLQPAAGGRLLPYAFWREFAEVENVLAIKMAPFNRYQTIDVIRGVCEADRHHDIALYTGNDDNMVTDLLTRYRIATANGEAEARIVGGLLGHWSVWTSQAVQILNQCRDIAENNRPVPPDMLTLAVAVTDTNAAFFDAANNFAGCIAGIHEVLRRQGLMQDVWCLNPEETLSPGQKEEIDRVYQSYPELNDDEFVREKLDRWLAT